MKGFVVTLLLAGSVPFAALAYCAENQVEIRLTDGNTARFSVEVADEPLERGKGLMFREDLPASAGMLFLYERPQRAVFWMKNTLIPLDMIFADSTGVVRRVRENTIPHDETGIDGGPEIQAVLEINGGLSRRLGIGPGAVLRHPGFEQSTAAWACAVE